MVSTPAVDLKTWKILIPWLLFALVVLICIRYCSDGQFSAILTLSAGFECFSYILLIARLNVISTFNGLSVTTLYLLLVGLVSKVLTNTSCQNYLPVDKSGDWLFPALDIASIIGIAIIIITNHRKDTSDQARHTQTFDSNRKTKQPELLPVWAFILGAGVLSLVFYPTRCRQSIFNIIWAFSVYIQSIAQVPQIYLLSKANNFIDSLTGHYIAAQAASHFGLLIFWVSRYTKLGSAGPIILGSALVQNVVTLDFIVLYLRAIKNNRANLAMGSHIQLV